MSKTIKRIDSSLSKRERAAMRASRLSAKRSRARLYDQEANDHLLVRGRDHEQEHAREHARGEWK